MSGKAEDELEFINVVEHGSGASRPIGGSSSRVYAQGGTNPGFTGLTEGSLGFIRQSQHPLTALFHYLFKLLALLCYLFGTWFSSNHVFIFVLCILFLAFDFWTVKNISGRLMVGLRWWSHVTEEGTSEWVFESLENMGEINSADAKLFWIGLYATPLIWLGLFVVALFGWNFKWLVIVVIALLLSGANIYGYTKCSHDAKQKVKNLVQEGMAQGAVAAFGSSNVRNALFSLFLNTDSTPPNQQQQAPSRV